MQICITTIMFKNHPYIWEYDESLDEARCLFSLAGTKNFYEKSVLLERLRETKGIEITDMGEALIKNAQAFFKLNPMIPVYKMNHSASISATRFPPSIDAREKGEGPVFFGERGRSKSLSTPEKEDDVIEVILDRATSAPEHSNKPNKGIRIDTLIPYNHKSSSLWGITRSYEGHGDNDGYFSNKTKLDSSTRVTPISTTRTVWLAEYQYLKNRKLHPVKSEQMQFIRCLFDEILAPLYDEIAGDEELTNPALIAYFQQVITGVMVNSRSNLKSTEYESMLESKSFKEFEGDISVFEFAFLEARHIRAREMLKPLLFFISPDIRSQDLTEDSKVQNCLDLLKFTIQTYKHTESIAKILSQLENLTIQSAQIEHNSSLEGLKISKDQKDKIQQIGSSFSIYHLIFNFLKSEHTTKIKDKHLHSVTEASIEAIITSINNTMSDNKNIPRLFTGDGDLYLCKEWIEQLSTKLDKIKESKLLSKKFYKPKFQEELIAEIESRVVEFIRISLQELKPPKEPIVRITTPRPLTLRGTAKNSLSTPSVVDSSPRVLSPRLNHLSRGAVKDAVKKLEENEAQSAEDNSLLLATSGSKHRDYLMPPPRSPQKDRIIRAPNRSPANVEVLPDDQKPFSLN